MSSTIFSPPHPSAIGLRRNKATGVPRWSSVHNDSPRSSDHNSRPSTSDGVTTTGNGDHDWRSPSSASSIGHYQGQQPQPPSGDIPRKRRPLMVTSRQTNLPLPSQTSRPYPFMSAQAQDSIPWLLEHKERGYVAENGDMETKTETDDLDGGGYIMRGGAHAGRSHLASTGASLMLSPGTSHSHRSIGHGWSSPRSQLESQQSSSYHHQMAYPPPPHAPYPPTVYASPPSTSGSSTARQYRLPQLSRSVEFTSSHNGDSRPTTGYSSISGHKLPSTSAGILSPRAPSSEPFSTQPSQVAIARRQRSRSAVRQAALADLRNGNTTNQDGHHGPRRNERSASLSHVAAVATGATGLSGLERQGHAWAMRPSCYVESHSASNWKTRHDQLQHYFNEMERQKERRRAIAAVEEEKWLTEIEHSWRLELDELKKRRSMEAIEDRVRATEMEMMRQADEEKQWSDMESRIARAKILAAQEHSQRMEEKRLQQVRLLEEEKEQARLQSLKVDQERNRLIDREVKKTMTRMLDILVETSRQSAEEEKRKRESQKKAEAMERSVMEVADREKKAEDAARLAQLGELKSKQQRSADEEIRKKREEDERIAKAIADAKAKFEADLAAAEAKKKADIEADAARIKAKKDEVSAFEQRISSFAAVFAEKRSRDMNADQAQRDAIEQARLAECHQMLTADAERKKELMNADEKKIQEEKSRRQEIVEMRDAEAERDRDIIREAQRKRDEAEAKARAEHKAHEMLMARYSNAFAYKRALEEQDVAETERLRRQAEEAAAAAEEERLRLEREAAEKAAAEEAERKRREEEAAAEAARRAAAEEAERKRIADEQARIAEEARLKSEADAKARSQQKPIQDSKTCIIL